MKRFASWKLPALAVLLGWVVIQLAVAASLWSYSGRTEDLVFQQNRTTARLLVDQSLYIEHWEKLETDARFIPMVQDVADNLRRHEHQARFIRPFDAGGERRPESALEERLLKQFTRPPEELELGERPQPEFWERLVDGGKQYEYYQPVYAEGSCVVCHNAFPVQLDSFGSVIEVFPYDPLVREVAQHHDGESP